MHIQPHIQTVGRRSGRIRNVLEIGGAALKLGLTSFGGPVAHLGYFREEYVIRRKWIDERTYADLVSLCQFLPGPASSQVGIGLGLMRGGVLGGIAAWLGFTLPSAAAMAAFAYWLTGTGPVDAGLIHGLKLAAVAVVAQAVLGMGRSLAPDAGRALIAVAAAIAVALWPAAYVQLAVIAAAGCLGSWLYRERGDKKPGGTRLDTAQTTAAAAAPGPAGASPGDAAQLAAVPESAAAPVPAAQTETAGMQPAQAFTAASLRRKHAVVALTLFFALLAALPVLRQATGSGAVALVDSFYRAGSLVFGGGHVVLPLLEREAVPAGWVTHEQFLAGYGAAQAMPGPLFTFASYLGTVADGVGGALIATLAIFLPAFLLVAGTLPFWDTLRNRPGMRGALTGVNAAVVGLLLAALYSPIWTETVRVPADFAVSLAAFAALVYVKLPPWAVVLGATLAGWGLAAQDIGG